MPRFPSSAMALLIALSMPADSSGQAQAPAPAASPLELTISGPGIVRTGQTLLFKATLINRSSAPIAISMRQPNQIFSTFSWKITNSDGKENPHLEATERFAFCPLSVPLRDADIRILQPGEHFEIKNAGDPSDLYAFPGKGTYVVTYRYEFSPSIPVEGVDHKYWIGMENLSQVNVDRLKNTPSLSITSNTWLMRYE